MRFREELNGRTRESFVNSSPCRITIWTLCWLFNTRNNKNYSCKTHICHFSCTLTAEGTFGNRCCKCCCPPLPVNGSKLTLLGSTSNSKISSLKIGNRNCAKKWKFGYFMINQNIFKDCKGELRILRWFQFLLRYWPIWNKSQSDSNNVLLPRNVGQTDGLSVEIISSIGYCTPGG